MAYKENRKPAEADIYERPFYEYLTENCLDRFKEILADPNPDGHFPILINFFDLATSCNNELNTDILLFPDKVIPAGDKTAKQVLTDCYESLPDKANFILKRHLHLRFHSMPSCVDRYMTKFPGCKEVNTFVTLVGTVVRISAPKLLEFMKYYKCTKCKQVMTVEADASLYHRFPKTIDKCENLCVGGKLEMMEESGSSTTSTNFRFRDYQEIKLQEQISQMDFGIMPKALWVVLEDDLVDSVKPGDDVKISGTLFLRWKPFRVGQKMEVEVTFKANHVEVNNDSRVSSAVNPEEIESFENFWREHEDNPFIARNLILKSFCPQMYGMYVVKMALCVVLAGGVPKENAGTSVRGESHLLLVGDPGTGKSQFLKYATKICPRSVMTTGIGTTSAGLTVSAVKDGGDWHLEAGALVLADGGVCCIDEFSDIKEHDKVSIHEAMEQQTISIAKAGMVCKLNTKCTVIAATNPKLTKYAPEENLEMNVGLASPLLSRFDLVVVLKDGCNESWDEFLASFILEDKNPFEAAVSLAKQKGLIWNTERLQSYLVLIKTKRPEMTQEVQQILGRYYQMQRRSANRIIARTTVRLLESLFRLAEGHARLMFRDCVLLHDAITAISLMEASMSTSAIIGPGSNTSSLHTAFPVDPLEEYYAQAKAILNALNFPELWESERIYLENLKSRCSKAGRSSPPPPPNNPPKTPPSSSGHILAPETQYSEPGQSSWRSAEGVPASGSINSPPLSFGGDDGSGASSPELFVPEGVVDDEPVNSQPRVDTTQIRFRFTSTQNSMPPPPSPARTSNPQASVGRSISPISVPTTSKNISQCVLVTPSPSTSSNRKRTRPDSGENQTEYDSSRELERVPVPEPSGSEQVSGKPLTLREKLLKFRRENCSQ